MTTDNSLFISKHARDVVSK